MAKGEQSNSPMNQSGQNDCINMIFDKESPPSTRSRSRSRSSCESSRSSGSSGSGRYRGRGKDRGHNSSSPSTSSSSPRPRSRSYPRCNRRSSRCRCENHPRSRRDHHNRSPPRRFRAHSRSYSRSPSVDRYSQRRQNRSSSRSTRRNSRPERVPRSSPRTHRNHSRSRSSHISVSLSLDDKREIIKTAETNAMKILGVEKLEVPEIVKPTLLEQFAQSELWSPVPETRLREDLEKTLLQDDEMEPDMSNPKMSPKRKIIAFSINNSVAKPTLALPSGAKVTARVDSYESRKPYGHWIPVRAGKSSRARKHTLAKSH